MPPGLFEDLPPHTQLLSHEHMTSSTAPMPRGGPAVRPGLAPPPPAADISGWRGRITFYCIAESFDRKKAEELLKLTYPPGTIRSFPDVFHIEYIRCGVRALGVCSGGQYMYASRRVLHT